MLVAGREAELATLLGDMAGLFHLLQAHHENPVVYPALAGTFYGLPDIFARRPDGLVTRQDRFLDVQAVTLCHLF